MFNSRSLSSKISNKISKKVTILFLAGTIAMGQSFNACAAGELGFFGNLFKTAKENLLEAIGYNKIKKGAAIAACGLAGLAGYKFLAKPVAWNLFGRPAKVATKVLDFSIKWSFVAGLFGVAIYLYHLYSEKKLLNAINRVDANVTKTREDVLTEIDKTKTELTGTINTRSDAIDAQLEDVKKDTNKIKTIKENTEKILNAVDPEVAKVGKAKTVKKVKLEESSDL